ncbi:MAG: 30S ribosomal protein S20 [Candidatus Nealsonbacteria bacterium]|nr:30S ribosomal protein S20 [Candidatus Nealsonbacteria bacterium]
MPITNSAKKALRQNLKRRKINSVKKRKIKDFIKEARTLVSQNKTDEAKKLLPKIYKILDKTAKSGLIKKNAASRKKSRITALINRKQTKQN